MTEPIPADLVAGARAYEETLVPALFRDWCPRVLDAAGVSEGDRVLDVACGTGVLAREAARRVGGPGLVAGVDPGPGMLAVARELGPGIEWTEGTAESLPHEDGTFDAVVSQFGLMFFPDRVRALREMARAAKPGGRMAVAVWESLERTEALPIEVELLERMAGEAAANALRAPFVLGDTKELAALFAEAGIGSVRVETHAGTGRYANVRTMVEADLRGWLPVMGVPLEEPLIEEILAEAESALAQYVTDEGTVEFRAPAHVVSGVVPA